MLAEDVSRSVARCLGRVVANLGRQLRDDHEPRRKPEGYQSHPAEARSMLCSPFARVVVSGNRRATCELGSLLAASPWLSPASRGVRSIGAPTALPYQRSQATAVRATVGLSHMNQLWRRLRVLAQHVGAEAAASGSESEWHVANEVVCLITFPHGAPSQTACNGCRWTLISTA